MDRIERLERKRNEAEARLRKAQREVRDQEKKIRTRCLIIMGGAILNAIKKAPSDEQQTELLRLIATNSSPQDVKYIEENYHSFWE